MRMRGLTKGTKQHFKRDGTAKKAYEDEVEAAAAAFRSHKQMYKCDFCGKYHVGGELAAGKRADKL
jgi:transposase-like protein